MRRLAVLGPGLLGGSVALAARQRGLAGQVALWARRAEAVDEIRASGSIEIVSDQVDEVVEGADLVVLATPVGALPALLREILPMLQAGAAITDLCSVKGTAVEIADAAIAESGRGDISFVGAHPMAGSEQTGFAYADASLFEHSACAITPGATSSKEASALVEGFWADLGCRTVLTSAAEHDSAVARVSHVPHLAASALVLSAIDDEADAGRLIGPGFRDTTRVASGAPGMWTEILAENREAVCDALGCYIDQLGEVLAKLRDMDNEGLRQFLVAAKDRRAAQLSLTDTEELGRGEE